MAPNQRPCEIELCPALAVEGWPYCAGHQRAKKLGHVAQGAVCIACKRVLYEGDFVTPESGPGCQQHAVCPPRGVKKPRRDRGATPLFDGA